MWNDSDHINDSSCRKKENKKDTNVILCWQRRIITINIIFEWKRASVCMCVLCVYDWLKKQKVGICDAAAGKKGDYKTEMRSPMNIQMIDMRKRSNWMKNRYILYECTFVCVCVIMHENGHIVIEIYMHCNSHIPLWTNRNNIVVNFWTA